MKQKKQVFEDEKQRKLWHMAMVRRFERLRALAKERRDFEKQMFLNDATNNKYNNE